MRRKTVERAHREFDETDPGSGRFALTAPLARQLSGKRPDDSVVLQNAQAETEDEITAIDNAQE